LKIGGYIVDIEKKTINPGEVTIENGIIKAVSPAENVPDQYLIPGFIDAHVHIESSMVVPAEFARMAVVHGTVATVSDPHEIANVLGVEGVEYMIENGKQTPFKFYFGAPSCVPATVFETAGASIDSKQIKLLLERNDICYLAEMMNWPGVLYGDAEVQAKISIAKQLGKTIDGHAPGLRGEDARKYIRAGISTDHECFTREEALDKLTAGMKIIIREGSAAKNFEALFPLLNDYANQMMLCSDDKHPDSLEEGHINILVKRAIEKGIDVFNVLRAACINPILHYGLKVGRLRPGDSADFIVVRDLKDFQVKQTFIDGILVAEDGVTKIKPVKTRIVNNFSTSLKKADAFAIQASGHNIRVIEVIDDQIVTNSIIAPANIVNGYAVSNTANDILKIAVVNRYHESSPALAFVKNFGLGEGAIASSVGHDSHNIVAVGVDDESLCDAVNLIIESKGGICAVTKSRQVLIPLPVAGIMSDNDGYAVSKAYQDIDLFVKQMGCRLNAPFMTLSFMALLVIPSLKLSDKGLFDGVKFQFTDLFVKE
jgi:adenine deaminase